jgi:hypothetical protein
MFLLNIESYLQYRKRPQVLQLLAIGDVHLNNLIKSKPIA